jgi:tetratricopeptide (TPR) repeat protein
MNSHKFEPDIMKERAQCFENLGKFPKAAQIYQKVLESDEDPDPILAKSYLQVLEISNKLDQAPTVLERVLTRIYKNDLMNLLAELYLKLGKYEKCLEFVRKLGRDGYPIEIEVRVAVCVARSGQEQEAEPVFAKLSKISVHHYPDLYVLVGDTYKELNKHEIALQFYEPLRAVPDFDTPELWLKCAKLYEHCDDDLSAEEAYQMVLESDATELNSECRIQLARLYMRIGDKEKALKALMADDKTEIDTKCRLDMEKANMYMLEGDLEGYYKAAREAIDSAVSCEAQSREGEDGEKVLPVWQEPHQSVFMDFALTLQTHLLSTEQFSEVLRLNSSLIHLSLFRSE